MHDGSLLGPFSLTKRAPKEILFARISFSFQKAPDDTGVSSAAALDQRRCLWKPQPFEKGWRKLYVLQPLLQPPRSVKFFLCLLSFFTKKKVRDKVPEILRGGGGMIELPQTVDRLGQKGADQYGSPNRDQGGQRPGVPVRGDRPPQRRRTARTD